MKQLVVVHEMEAEVPAGLQYSQQTLYGSSAGANANYRANVQNLVADGVNQTIDSSLGCPRRQHTELAALVTFR